jgi:hypothetical protein
MMRKIVIAMLGIGATLIGALPAEAQNHQRRRDQRPAVRHVAPAPRYYAPPRYAAPRYARPQRNWVPYAVGALGAVAVGAYFYNQYGEVCQRIVVDQYWNGYRYVPVTETVCE